ncbi:hypothetical protein KO566_01015 [Flavobacteriaceae bacterium XHP0103]|uniref:hypothetical protein n=1 Tax=Marixanthotalea marina TaxID=2844359 RepID=UPI002989DF2C|nr:hypothetical protein [Marixanthotalea marina]MBU3820624.1 hypothetical protein [Marixanthotalea marina]
MKYKSFTLLVVILLCFVTKSFSQRGNYRITNGIGVFGGITKFDIATDNFVTNQGNGFLGGFSATVDIPFKWYNISYDIQLSENNVGILARPSIASTTNEFIDYKVFAAQIALLAHIKIIETYLTIDVGPMLQYNGKMELKDKSKEGYFINNYTNLTSGDISNISQFNFDGAIGASAGFKNFKLKAQYIYGFTNILKKLEKQDIDTTGGDSRFKGNQNMLVLGAMILF